MHFSKFHVKLCVLSISWVSFPVSVSSKNITSYNKILTGKVKFVDFSLVSLMKCNIYVQNISVENNYVFMQSLKYLI